MLRGILAIGLLLFGSGVCALVYQIAWAREFRLVFGGTNAASGAVLAIFMGGLGVGNALFGQRADREQNPLRLYAFLEFGISFAVGVSPWLTDLSRALYTRMGGELTLGSTGATVVRLLLALLVLGLPTCLMGGTLPAAVRAVTSPNDRGRRGAGLLYGLNTLGAVTGAVLSTFMMLEHLGTRATLWTACGVNVLIAAIAFLISRSTVPTTTPATTAEPVADASDSDHADVPPWPSVFVYLAAAIVGLAFFLMEMVWFRMLSPLLGGTTFSLGTVLVMALLGIGLGGIAYSFGSRKRAPSPTGFALTCALEAVALIFPFALGDQLAILTARLANQDHTGLWPRVADWSLISAIVILPAAIISGWQFPMLIALLGRGRAAIGKQAGLAFAANTAGAIVGLLAGGFGIFSVLTALGCWRMVTWLLASLSLLGIALSWRHRKSLLGPAISLILCAAAIWLQSAPGPTAAWRHSAIGAGRTRLSNSDPNELQNWLNLQRRNIIWEADGKEASVAISQQHGLAFVVNGKSDGNSLLDMQTQILLGLFGSVLHPNPETCLMVGLGTGESAGWAAALPSVKRLDVVEIEPTVTEIARRCEAVNNNVLKNPRVNLIYNDAREVLLTSPQKYDVIISEPSNLFRAGVPNLYTQEFYEAVRSRLKPGGMFVQWLQIYEAEPAAVQTVFSTLRSVFKHQEAWQSLSSDLFLVCSSEPPHYEAAALRKTLQDPSIKEVLQTALQIQDLEGWLAHYVSGPEGISAFIGDPAKVAINTDDRNIVEFGFARSLGAEGVSCLDLQRLARDTKQYRPPISGAVSWDSVDSQYLAQLSIENERIPEWPEFSAEVKIQGKAYKAYVTGEVAKYVDIWNQQSRTPQTPAELLLLAGAYADLNRPEAAKLIERLRSTHPWEADALEALHLHRRKQYDKASRLLIKSVGALRTNPWSHNSVCKVAIQLAQENAAVDPANAKDLFEVVSKPFELHRTEELRCRVAYNIAATLRDPALMTRAIAAYEPHVPWQEVLLQTRAEVYRNTGNPLAIQAQGDLEQYLRQVALKPKEPVAQPPR